MIVHRVQNGPEYRRLVVHGAESVYVDVDREGVISWAQNTNTLDGTDGWLLVQRWADQPGSCITRQSFDVRAAGMGWHDEYRISGTCCFTSGCVESRITPSLCLECPAFSARPVHV